MKKTTFIMPVAIAGLAISALTAASAFACEQTIATNRDGQIEFRSPSGNIGCLYSPQGVEGYMSAGSAPELTCSRNRPSYVTLVMSGSGRITRMDKPLDRSCCSGVTLAWGKSWSAGPFRCRSATDRLTCTGPGEHAFSIGRSAVVTRLALKLPRGVPPRCARSMIEAAAR
jgi:hypothetical protein